MALTRLRGTGIVSLISSNELPVQRLAGFSLVFDTICFDAFRQLNERKCRLRKSKINKKNPVLLNDSMLWSKYDCF